MKIQDALDLSLNEEAFRIIGQPLRVLLQIPFGIAPLDHVVSQLVH